MFVFLFAMVGIIVYAIMKKKVKTSQHAILLVVVVSFNVCIWLIEQFIDWDFEFLSISYIASELLLLLLYGMIQDYEQAVQKAALASETVEMVKPKIQMDDVMEWDGLTILSAREKDVLKGMLEDKKRKEIAEELCITENTVKKHVSSIFSKLNVDVRKLNTLYIHELKIFAFFVVYLSLIFLP